MNLSKGLLMTALITGCVYGGVTPVFAEEQVAEFTLDPMIVTATRTEKHDLEIPASVSVVTAEDINKTGATTVYEALSKVIGITPYAYNGDGDDNGSSYSRILIRGFDKGALVLLNGAPVNMNNYGSVSGIPVDSIERIEVVKGAQSVLYGAEALGGVVNIITKKGSGKPSTKISGTTGSYFHNWNVSTQGDGYLISVGKDFKDQYNHSAMDKPSAKTGQYRVNSSYTREYAFASVDLSKNLNFNFQHSEMNPSYLTKNLETNKKDATSYKYKDRKNFIAFNYKDDDYGYKATLAYNEKRVESWGISTANKVSRSDSSNYKYSNLYFDNQKTFEIGKDSLTVGIDAKHEKYDQMFASKADNKRDSAGLYVSYDKKFSSKFNTILGVRGQYYGSTDWEESHKVFLPQLQTVLKLNDTSSWYTSIGKAFEVSALNSITSAGGASTQEVLDHSPKPEQGWNYETGFKKITDTTSSKVSVFYMNYKDKFKWIPITPGSDSKIQVNMGKFHNTGVEYEFKKELSEKWSYDLGLTYQKPESYDTDMQKWLQEASRLQGKVGVDYKIGKLTANLNGVYLGNREQSYYKYGGGSTNSRKDTDHKLNEYIQLNTALSYAPDKNSNFKLTFYNILDRKDSVAEYEYYTLPFNWTVTYSIKF